MLPRILEPEAMDTLEEARDYDAMDHSAVNARFVADFLQIHGPCRGGNILDLGTGTAHIPIQLARADAQALIVAVDLAKQMLRLANRNVTVARLERQIQVEKVDAKDLPYPDGAFEAVISNTIIHHIPEPEQVLADVVRLVAPGGTLMIRDLYRPDDAEQVAALVALYAGGESDSGRNLFEASLNASLTLDEIRAMIQRLGLEPEGVKMTSDRHWTWVWKRD